jgi:hypothetical protein
MSKRRDYRLVDAQDAIDRAARAREHGEAQHWLTEVEVREKGLQK